MSMILYVKQWRKNMKMKDMAVLYEKSHKIPLRKLIADEGNHKIPSSTAIFNMGTATNCPAKAFGLCNATKHGVFCYALKAENTYKEPYQYRKRQERLWKNTSSEDFAFQLLMINSTKRKPFTALRLNESGDFWGQKDVEKAEKVARILKRSGIITYCYTSRSDLDYRGVRDLVISGSGFRKEGVKSIFEIIGRRDKKLRGFGICKGNCRICNRCQKGGRKTCVREH